MNYEGGAKISRDASHRIDLIERKHLEVRGVTDVISFDEQLVLLDTVCGRMEIEGETLQIHVLSIEEGIVSLDGLVTGIQYTESRQESKEGKSGFWGRLFR